ncbi:D-glycero-beta-D-manno-heptose-7-phosphate kinase [Helicobacter monodelphidis]|nr:D-glycero-beta-D-manno-heptose-7-phosphate kinase [Helicobacter sp. 15-1451]
MIDHYIWGNCERISPEAPVAVIEVKKENHILGGACNVVHNLLSLGAEVLACGVIGQDEKGEELLQRFRELNLSQEGVIVQKGRPTTQKSRIIASNQQVARVDWEQKSDISRECEEAILRAVRKHITQAHGVIISDYGKGVLTHRLSQAIITEANKHHKIILVDPKGRDYTKYRYATLLTPNKKEAFEATGIEIVDDSSLYAALRMLKESCELEYSLITLSEEGIAVLQQDKMCQIPTVAKEVFDVTGAGDTVISALSFALSLGAKLESACAFANAAAAVVVSKIGSATASLEEIMAHFKVGSKVGNSPLNKIVTLEKLPILLQELRLEGKRIVWSNGCFDILHYGHVRYLQEAKNFGDVLILGVNNDESVRALKGDSRPINSLQDRLGVLCALECVDYVIAFGEMTPLSLIEIVRPDTLVKGGDYFGKEVVGSQYASKVKLVEFLEGYSSSSVIQKIKNSC